MKTLSDFYLLLCEPSMCSSLVDFLGTPAKSAFVDCSNCSYDVYNLMHKDVCPLDFSLYDRAWHFANDYFENCLSDVRYTFTGLVPDDK